MVLWTPLAASCGSGGSSGSNVATPPNATTATCTGSSPTWTSTADRTSVASCVSSAVSGDTINVVAGSQTWASAIDITNKNLTITGAGVGSTVIATWGFNFLNSASNISGFTFNLGTGNYMNFEGSRNFRFHHNAVTMLNWDSCLFSIGSLNTPRSNTPSYGLFDHNTLANCRVVVFGEYTDTGGSDRWAEPLDLGGPSWLFLEDNTYTITDPNCTSGGVIFCNFVDNNLGGKYVARFNAITNSYFEQHSLQAGCCIRGGRGVQIYNNTMIVTAAATPNFSRPFFIRGGTGFIFHNTTLSHAYSVNAISIDNVRTTEDRGAPFHKCDGTNFPDGNANPLTGYPCRDQIGRGDDASYWDYNNPAPAQALVPMYAWLNNSPSGEQVFDYNIPIPPQSQDQVNLTLQIVENRDFYQYKPSFNGTQGVGEGLLADRSSTCTTGVAYWATDQGEWNSNQPGPDGQLYQCTAPNVWSLYWTPYAYPHPLQQ